MDTTVEPKRILSKAEIKLKKVVVPLRVIAIYEKELRRIHCGLR